MIWWLAALLFSAGSINSTAQVGEPTNTVGRWELLMEYASMVSVSHMIWYSHIDLLKEILELPVQWPQLTTYHSVTRLYTGAQCSQPGPQHAKYVTRARALSQSTYSCGIRHAHVDECTNGVQWVDLKWLFILYLIYKPCSYPDVLPWTWERRICTNKL